jgi:hypothetical protein
VPDTEVGARAGSGKRGLIEVGEFVPAAAGAFPTATPAPRTRAYVAILAAIVSIGLHLAFIATVVGLDPGMAAPARQPQNLPAAVQLISGFESYGDNGMGTLQTPAARLPEPVLSPIHVSRASLANLPSVATDEEETNIYGLYVRQIDARIERVWHRPRTPIGASQFSCRVAINQDIAGNVLDWTLQECNGDARWQQSLISAIRSSSPLPAAPDPNLYRRNVQLTFRSEAYDPHGPSELYESVPEARK